MQPVSPFGKRILPLVVPLGAAVLAAACLLLYGLRARIERSSADGWTDASARPTLHAGVEQIAREEGFLLLTGWALDEGVEYQSYNWGNGSQVRGPWNDSRLALLDAENGALYLLPTQARAPAADASWLPEDGLDYGRCSLTARVPVSGLPGLTEICVTFTLPDGSRYLYHTGEEVGL